MKDLVYVYCDERDLIHESQAGFRKGYSIIDNLFMLKCIIDLFVWKKRKLFCLFIDYRKAFDMVWRDGLWYKLIKAGITGKLYTLVRNMYSNKIMCCCESRNIKLFCKL